MVSIATRHMVGVALTVALACGTVAFGQAPQESAAKPPAAQKPIIPLKMQVTLSRLDGDKKVGSLPFTLWVNVNDDKQTTLNFGLRIPTPNSAVVGDSKTQTPTPTSYTYNNAGTNITSSATSMDDGRFRVYLTISDSSLVPGKDALSAGMPTFQSFSTSNYLILRDGQTAQFVAATDKVSGEVTKVEVTINVLK